MRPKAASRPLPKRKRPVPSSLRHLFWDFPGKRLTLDGDRDLVVRRVAGEGGLREVRLLRARIGDAAIREVIERTQARGLSPQRIRFWQLVLRLPTPRADAWVRAARTSTWSARSGR